MRGFLRGGVLVALVSLALVLLVPSNSAEFVVSVCSLLMGLTLIGLIALFSWLARR
ncbi:MAG TPA: hypothetical protein VK003_04385 [Oceanobacillus sp.]|nr:hypothetical protein [Oceanobacillus sp.]